MGEPSQDAVNERHGEVTKHVVKAVRPVSAVQQQHLSKETRPRYNRTFLESRDAVSGQRCFAVDVLD